MKRGCITKIIIVLVLILLIIWALKGCNDSPTEETKIGLTPTEITQIKDIGQWEFLAINDEEIVDTVRHSFFGDDELARIYYGTVRLGINLHQTQEDWITVDKDTINIILPPIQLLDNKFLDEARTQSFFETGKWSEADKAALTKKAAQMMLKKCMTPENIRDAEKNATLQFTSLMTALGYTNCRIRFVSTTH